MKIVRHIILVIGILLLLAYAYSEWSSYQARKPVQEALAALKRDGFKTDLAEFDLELNAEEAKNFQILTNAGIQAELPKRFRMVDLATPVKADAGYVSLRDITTHGGDYWTALHDHLRPHNTVLDEACQVLLSAPTKASSINTNFSFYIGIPDSPYPLRYLSDVISWRTLLESHEGNHISAWTNLLALTRLAARQNPAPFEIHHLLRFQSISIAARTTWETLQANIWTEDQLSSLQHEWESAELWKQLPDIIAHKRIGSCEIIRSYRKTPSSGSSVTLLTALKTTFQSPTEGAKSVFDWTRGFLRNTTYRKYGTHEFELSIIKYYREKKIDFRRAITSLDWRSISQHRAVTNSPFYSPIIENEAAQFEAMYAGAIYHGSAPLDTGGILGAAAEAETIRRLTIVAIALKRFQLRFQNYPDSLPALAPQFIAAIPTDFMDSQPLRYRKTVNDDFVLYSVGHDGIDHGGLAHDIWTEFIYLTPNYDIVWLRPATRDEILSLPKSFADYRSALFGKKAYNKSIPSLMQRYGLKLATPRYLESTTTNKP